MKKRYHFLFGLLLVCSYGCQNESFEKKTPAYKVETLEKQLEPFKRLTVKSGNANIYLKQADVESLKIEAEENILAAFNIHVENETLEIEQKTQTNFNPSHPINFYVSAKNLVSISLYGSEVLATEGNFKTDRLRVSISGSGKATLDVTGNEMLLKILGSGKANVKGSVNLQKVAINGNADYNADDLMSKEAYVSINGSGSASVNVQDVLNIKIFGSGVVKYSGTPEIEQNISGSGSIESVNSKAEI